MDEVEEVSTIITEAEVGKSKERIALQDVDSSVEVLDPEEEMYASSDADPTLEVVEVTHQLLEKSIDEVVIGESSTGRAEAVEDKMDTSKDRVDDAPRKRKSVDREDLLEEEMEVMSIEGFKGSSPVKKLREKSGSTIPPCSE